MAITSLDRVGKAMERGSPPSSNASSGASTRRRQLRKLAATSAVTGRAGRGQTMTVHKAQGSKWGRVVIVAGLNFDHNIPTGK
jgi:hypothetical protein